MSASKTFLFYENICTEIKVSIENIKFFKILLSYNPLIISKLENFCSTPLIICNIGEINIINLTRWKILWEKVTVIGFTLLLQFGLLAVIDHDGRACRDGCGCIVSFVLRNNKSNPDRCVQEPSGCLFSAAKRSIIPSCVTDSRLWPFRHLLSQSPQTWCDPSFPSDLSSERVGLHEIHRTFRDWHFKICK